MKRFFTLEYWQDDEWFVGKLKEVPGIFSQGQTLDELKENIADAYHMMIEAGEALATWQVSADPADLAPSASLPARKLPDHRTAYLTYEGPVSGNRGSVRLDDRGHYDATGDPADLWTVSLTGGRVEGRFSLHHIEGDAHRLTRLA